MESALAIGALQRAKSMALTLVRRSVNAIARLVTTAMAVACVGCGYSGDGEFETHGTWPLSAYKLRFPEWKPLGKDSRQYKIRGWKSHSSTYLTMTLTAPDPMVFAEAPMLLAVTIASPDGRNLYASDPDVFAHLKRMQRTGETAWPLPQEWRCDHDWGDKAVNRRVVPFIAGATPKPQTTLNCLVEVPMPDGDYDFTVRCIACDRVGHVSVAFTFRSGWK